MGKTTEHKYYSHRSGPNPLAKGLGLQDIISLFRNMYVELGNEGLFAEALGHSCKGLWMEGSVGNVEEDILVSVRKRNLWPILPKAPTYSEEDLFDVIEYLYQRASLPGEDRLIDPVTYCRMHWKSYDEVAGRELFRGGINELLKLYERRFALSERGEVLAEPEQGFAELVEAKVPSEELPIVNRVESAVLKFRRHGAELEDKRQAVRDLADALEYLKPRMEAAITRKDESDLFNIANNFGIRHHSDKQKTDYDTAIWLDWMFYFYLSTIHVVLHRLAALQ